MLMIFIDRQMYEQKNVFRNILPFFLLKANPSSFFPVFSVFSAIIPQNLLFCERFFMDDGQGQEWTRWTEWTRMDY